ncbi:MAG TPA: CHRD domain-containing protein [Usitatibacter sp.]|nr:CHRD domain-containing protein [Usitatibacter sp.]
MNKNVNPAGWAGALLLAAALGGCSAMDKMSDKMSGSPGAGEKVTLSGANEVPPVQSGASGTGTVAIGSDKTVKVDIKVSGMQPTAAHIHEGAAGANGPVVVPLQKKGSDEFVTADGAKLTDAQYEAYKAGRLYVNVHSDTHKGGEIRAQLKGR